MFRTSRCYTNSLKMNVFFDLSVGVAEILSMGLSDRYDSFLWTDFSVEELFLLNNENSYVMFNWRKLVSHGIYQKSVYKIEFYRPENHAEEFSAFSALR